MHGFNGYGLAFMPWIFLAGKALFWFVVIIVMAVILKNNSRRGTGGKDDDAIRILRARYAQGEIDKAEFDAKMNDLR